MDNAGNSLATTSTMSVKERNNSVVVMAAKKMSKTAVFVVAVTGIALVGGVTTVATIATAGTATSTATATGAVGAGMGYVLN